MSELRESLEGSSNASATIRRYSWEAASYCEESGAPLALRCGYREAPLLIREAQLTVRGERRPVAVLFPRHTLHVAER